MDRLYKMRSQKTDSHTSIKPALIIAGLFLLILTPNAFSKDWLALRDGTIIECNIAKEEDMAIFLQFKNGSIRVGREHIALLARETPDEFVPTTEYEKEQVEKGKVKFEGSWVTTTKRNKMMDKRYKIIKKKIDEIEKHKSWHHAYEIKTKTAIIKSNAPKEIVDYYVEQWEAFANYFIKDWKVKFKAGKKRKTPVVCIYKSQKDYDEYADPPPGAKGFFSRMTEELHIYHDRTDMRDTLETLFHEGTHLLVFRIDPTFVYPTWMNEGMAEYISANTYDGKNFYPGELQGDRLIPLEMSLANGQLMPVEEMINLPQLSFLARGGYPPAWAFTHFLMNHKSYKNRYKEFFLGIARGKAKLSKDPNSGIRGVNIDNLLDAFKRIFKKDMYSLQDDWHAHIRDLLSNLDGKSYFYKGQVRYMSRDRQGAKKDLQKALDMGADLPECHFLFGMSSVMTGSIQEGLNSIRTAIELDPLNSRYYLGLGQMTYIGIKDGKKQGKALLDLALEIDPDNLLLQRQYDGFFSTGKTAESEPEDDDD